MRRTVRFAPDGDRTVAEGGPIHLVDDGWMWIDVTDPDDADIVELARILDLDRVAREDLVEEQFPKVELLEHHWMLVLYGLAVDSRAVRTVEVDILVGDRWLVTVHAEPLQSIDHVFDRIQRPSFRATGPAHLAVRIAEFLGERYLPILDDLDGQVLDLEDEAVEGDPSVLPDIHALRRDIALLRRVLGPQRRTLDVLTRTALDLDDATRRDLSDALDHHNHMVDSLDSAHQMVATVLDTYRGAAAERMNEVMKVLTVFSAIFMPLTLIAGIYGMNFENMPELRQPWAYGSVLAAMVVIGASLWLYFVRRGFIGGPKIRDLARPAKVAGRVGRGLASAAMLPLRVTPGRRGGNGAGSSRTPTSGSRR
ncbi:magnesium/cobalt transporter CorA [Actinospongicola halichondriae]|uniref:magnesium/cobalt transporter CorA n=1 Tax=Actinospongicola halichondriae TaxID=3236844 RepID=UPI003D5A52AE